MNKEKLKLVLDLYKKDAITFEEAYLILEIREAGFLKKELTNPYNSPIENPFKVTM